jgi:glutaredoxin-like protein
MTATPSITVYGAAWCSDCTRTRRKLDGLGVAYDYIDVETVDGAPERAREISGRMSIPVVVYSDGTHQVEPSDPDVESKARALGLVG